MKLIIGLGNPGEKYLNTRHNAGFMVLDELKTRISNFQFPISNEIQNSNFKLNKKLQSLVFINSQLTTHNSQLILAKPQTFMNNSGKAVKKLMVLYKIILPDLWVIHDDLDIALGSYKIQKGVGPKLHNGVESIENELANKDFWRVRIGVDNRAKDKEQRTKGEPAFAKASAGKEYVLQEFSDDEKKILADVIDKVISQLMSSELRVSG